MLMQAKTEYLAMSQRPMFNPETKKVWEKMHVKFPSGR